jgi:hypothetical protein
MGHVRRKNLWGDGRFFFIDAGEGRIRDAGEGPIRTRSFRVLSEFSRKASGCAHRNPLATPLTGHGCRRLWPEEAFAFYI